MITAIVWITLTIVVGAIGSGRRIGGPMAFLLSLILSPLVGLIIVFVSPSKEENNASTQTGETFEEQQARIKKELRARLDGEQVPPASTEVEENKSKEDRLDKLLQKGEISQEEYDMLKSKGE
mgnify:CR=1 FL=1